MAKRKPSAKSARSPKTRSTPVGLRIIGGTFRGRKLQYAGERCVRPMKDRVREAVFNLVGPSIKGKHAVDLFAGTGAIGLEAISRGATSATFIECHYPTVRTLSENIATLAVESRCEVIVADTFVWLRQAPRLVLQPWVVFISPPYEFYVSRTEAMLGLVDTIYGMAPPESVLMVESDQRFDASLLSEPERWDIRDYPPARVGIRRKPAQEPVDSNVSTAKDV
ncbi:MAG: 16S rRNA (guanine(966)-N(2))-methyltransferase RsmD [Pirellulales bacterium]|nr:16S rRNA (guanine(966)-N(2))-methyltransferase RsmD [Pirellulales bacterium]